MPLSLETERLRLRPFREEDLAILVAYRSDPDVARYQSWDTPYTMAQARSFLADMQVAVPGQPDSWYQIAIEIKSTGEMIGDCAFCILGDSPQQAEIGFTLSRAYQGQGYAAEAVGRLLEYLFGTLGLRKVCANCDVENERSAQLLDRLGMVRRGPTERVRFKGEWCLEQWFALSRDRWEARSQ